MSASSRQREKEYVKKFNDSIPDWVRQQIAEYWSKKKVEAPSEAPPASAEAQS